MSEIDLMSGIEAEYPGLFWIKVMAISISVISLLYPVWVIVIGGYIRTRKERRGN